MGTMKKKAGKNSKDAQIIKQYEKTMTLTRKGWDAIVKFHEMPAVKAYLAARQPLPAAQPVKIEQKDNRLLDLHDEYSLNLSYVQDKLFILSALTHNTDVDLPFSTLYFTITEIDQHIMTIGQDRKSLQTLRPGEKRAAGSC